LVLEIFRFFKKHAQNLTTLQNNSVSWDLQVGFNSVFKGLSVSAESRKPPTLKDKKLYTESPQSWSPHTWSQIEEKYVKFPKLSRITSVGHKLTNRKWFPSVSHICKSKLLRKCT
jgi:hypothetical protein